jgi:hypothetical protein
MRCWGITKQLGRCKRESVASTWRFCSVHRHQVAYTCLSVAGGVFASYLATFLPAWHTNPQGVQRETKSETAPNRTDVGFVVGSPRSPVFWLLNEGEIPAERPKYGFVVYDLDEGDIQQPRRILHIPFRLFDDYILPKRALGPWRILELSARARQVPLGHHIFGYVAVQCFNCVRLRTYWLHFTNGHAGWFREASASEASVINQTLAQIIYSGERAAETVDKLISESNRVRIE